AQAADLGTGALDGRVDGEREALLCELDAVVHELDGDCHFTAARQLARGCARGRVLSHVLMDASQYLEGLILTEDLYQRGDDRVGGAGAVRVRHRQQALVHRVCQVTPAGRVRLASQGVLVDYEAEIGRAHV